MRAKGMLNAIKHSKPVHTKTTRTLTLFEWPVHVSGFSIIRSIESGMRAQVMTCSGFRQTLAVVSPCWLNLWSRLRQRHSILQEGLNALNTLRQFEEQSGGDLLSIQFKSNEQARLDSWVQN